MIFAQQKAAKADLAARRKKIRHRLAWKERLPKECGIGGDDIGLGMFGKESRLHFQILRFPGVIGIEQRHQRGPRGLDRGIAGARQYPIFLPDVNHLAAVWFEHPFQIGGIGTAIVYHDGLEVAKGLRAQGIQRFGNERRHVVSGNDDAYRRVAALFSMNRFLLRRGRFFPAGCR